MPSYAPPKKNSAYETYIALRDQSNTKVFKSNPTLATGDVKVIKDGGTPTNITTLPTVVNSGAVIEVSLSASEMDADNVSVLFQDVVGDEWCDLLITIHTASSQFDDLSTYDPATDEVDVGKVNGTEVNGVDDFKADVSNLDAAVSTRSTFDPTTNEVDIGKVKGNDVTGPNDFKADVSNLDVAVSTRSVFDPGSDSVNVGSILTAVAQTIADELLKRGIASVEDAADDTSLATLVLATFESNINGNTWNINKTDGSLKVAKAVTTDANAEPITGVT